MVFTLVYVSSATKLLGRAELEALLHECRTRNVELSVTGMLLYRDGNIMQLLEGDESVVRGLYGKITEDPRHHGLITIWTGNDTQRRFPDWTMGFRDLDSEPVTEEGYTDVLSRPVTEVDFGDHPSLGQKLLETFKKIG